MFGGLATAASFLFVVCFMTMLTLEVFMLSSQHPLLREMLGLQEANRWYIFSYLGKLFVFAMGTQVGFLFTNIALITYASLGLVVLFFLFFLFYRPY